MACMRHALPVEKNISFVRASRFLSLVLRHEPQKIGLPLDAQGWADIDGLLARYQSANGVWLTAHVPPRYIAG